MDNDEMIKTLEVAKAAILNSRGSRPDFLVMNRNVAIEKEVREALDDLAKGISSK